MENEFVFSIIKFDDVHARIVNAEGRMVCTKKGEVIEIYEGTMRNCINRQLEMLYTHDFTKEKWRVRNG